MIYFKESVSGSENERVDLNKMLFLWQSFCVNKFG